MDQLIIKTEKVKKVFGHIKALQGIDLEIRKGEFLTIFGPNGAGKTTLIKILTMLMKPTEGRIILAGVDVVKGKNATLKRMIGMISHNTFLYDNFTAYENLAFYASMYHSKVDKERLHSLLREVGLHDRKDDHVRTYSRGMQQRLSIARGIVHDPEIVFLDEPFTGLDQHAAKMLQKLLASIHTAGRTVVMVTHNLPRALEMSETISILAQGKIVFHVPSKEIEHEKFESLYLEAVGSSINAVTR